MKNICDLSQHVRKLIRPLEWAHVHTNEQLFEYKGDSTRPYGSEIIVMQSPSMCVRMSELHVASAASCELVSSRALPLMHRAPQSVVMVGEFREGAPYPVP